MREERIRRIGTLEPTYIYATLRTGTTGRATQLDQPAISFLHGLQQLTPGRPAKILGGFGISTAVQVEAVMPHVHAVVVGSALVREVAGSADPYAAVMGKMKELTGGSLKPG